jgi:hypothetical protein
MSVEFVLFFQEYIATVIFVEAGHVNIPRPCQVSNAYIDYLDPKLPLIFNGVFFWGWFSTWS